MGNICRSPTAHGVLEELVERDGLQEIIRVDSAGTHAYHVGSSPDSRSQKTAASRGVDLRSQRSRQAERKYYKHCDYNIAMDRDNLSNLQFIAPPEGKHKLHLLLDFAPELGVKEVPDPYYGGDKGFDKVFDLVYAASERLLASIKADHQL